MDLNGSQLFESGVMFISKIEGKSIVLNLLNFKILRPSLFLNERENNDLQGEASSSEG